MTRKITDEMGNRWEVSLEPTEDPTDTVDEEVVLHFVPAGDGDEREIRARGPMEELFETLPAADLRLAVEAAGNEAGFLFLSPEEGRLWWVRSAEEDPLSDGAAVNFHNATDEYHYSGALAAEPETLSEEELQEILEEARGVTSP